MYSFIHSCADLFCRQSSILGNFSYVAFIFGSVFTKTFVFLIWNSLLRKTYGRQYYIKNIFIGCMFTLGNIAVALQGNIVQSTPTRGFKIVQ